MGFWNFVGVVQGVLATFDLGCIAGASRELPMVCGAGKSEEERKIRSTTLLFTLLQNVFVGFFALVYFLLYSSNYVFWEMAAAGAAVLITIISSVQVSYITFFMGAQVFVPMSKINLLMSVVDGVAFPSCAYVWGLRGIMSMGVGSVLLRSVALFYAGRKWGIIAGVSLSRNILKRLLSFGVSLRLVDYANAFFNMVNVLWVTKFMGIESLALFSMARGFFSQVSDITARVGVVYAMRFYEQAGGGVSRDIMARQLKQFLFFQLLVLVPLFYWGAGVVIPFIIRVFIPKYAGADEAIIILLSCSFFCVINSGLNVPWIADKKLVARGLANTAGLFFMMAALFVSWFVLGGRSIEAVAYATVAGYYLYFVYIVAAVGRDFWRTKENIEIILTVSAASVWAFLVIYFGYLYTTKYTGLFEISKATAIIFAGTFFAILPVPLYGVKRSQLLQSLAHK